VTSVYATNQLPKPIEHRVEVEGFLSKPLLAETKITVDPPRPRVYGSATIIGYSNEQCVQYFKRISGTTRPIGYAGNAQSQGNEPKIGAGALWKGVGHIGVVVGIDGNMLTVEDANWFYGKITRHYLPVSSFRGFIYE